MTSLSHCIYFRHSLLEIWRIRSCLESQGSGLWERNLSQHQGSLQMSTWRISGTALKTPVRVSTAWDWNRLERIHLKERTRHDDLDLGAQVHMSERTGILDRTAQLLVSGSPLSTHLGPMENEHGHLGSSTGHKRRGGSQSLYSAPYIPESQATTRD